MISEERLARLALLEAGQRIASIFRNIEEDNTRALHVSREIIENILLPESPDLDNWIIEPLSGLENFEAGLPFFSLGLIHLKDKEPRYLAVLDPLRDELFEAALDFPAILNGRQIFLSTREKSKSLGSFAGQKPEVQETSWRSLGSWLLEVAYLSCGRLDIISYPHKLLSKEDLLFSWLALQAGAGKEEGEKTIILAPPSFFAS